MNKNWREARRIVALVLTSLLITALLTIINPSAANAAPAVTSLSVTSGTTLGGTAVTITGTSLTTPTSVTFGGVAGTSITNTSATQFTVTTPAHAAGAVDVVIIAASGTTTVASAYTYNLATLAPPTALALTPGLNSANGYYLTVGFTAAAGAATTRADLINNATGLTVGSNNYISNGNSFLGLLPNTSYTVNLYSVASSGTYTNGMSIAATATVTTTATAPAAISWTGITLTVAPSTTGSAAATTIVATLSGVPTGAVYYRYTLYDSAGTFIRVADTSSTSNSFVGLNPATTYKVSVKAYANGVSYLDSAVDLGPNSGTTATPITLTAPQATLSLATPDSLQFTYSQPAGAIAMRATLYDSTQTQIISSIPSSGTTPTFNGLTAGTTYYLSVVAVGDGISYLTSAPVMSLGIQTTAGSATLAAPSAAVAFATSPAGNAVTVSLTNNTGISSTSYNYYVYDSTNHLVAKYNVNSTALSILGLTYGATYKFGASMMASGYPESPITASLATITIGAAPSLTTLTTPTAPTTTTSGSTFAGSSLTGTISAVANASTYLWFLYDSTGTTVVSSQLINSTSVTFSGLVPSATYYIAAMAIGYSNNSGYLYGDSALSNKTSAVTAGVSVITSLAVPTPTVSVSATNPTPTAVTVTYTATTAGTYLSYTLKVYDASGNLISTIPYATTTTVVNGLQPNTGYSVTLTAIGDGVNYNSSAESGKVSFTTRGSMKIVSAVPALGALTPQGAILTFTAPTGTVSTVARLYDSSSRLLAVVPGFTSSSSISTSLLPGTSYKASLTFLGNGSTYLDSDEGALVNFTTPAAITIATPNVLQSATSAYTATFSFTIPTGGTYCRLTIWDSTGTSVISRIGQYTNGLVVSGLTPNTSYKASLKCFANGVGYLDSAESPLTAFSTGSGAKLLAPTISQVVAALTGYTISYVSETGTVSARAKIYDSNDNLLQSVAVASTTTFSILGLTPNTTYKVSMTAIGNGATYLDSDEGDKFTFSTAPAAPAMLPMPTWTSTATTVTVTVNESLVGYTAVRLYNATGSTLLSTYVTTGASVAIANLIPGTQYQISLVALANGYNFTASSESAKVIVNTIGLYQIVTGSISAVATTAATASVTFANGGNTTSTVGRLYAADGTLLGIYPSIGSGYVVGGLSPSTSYYFTIQNMGNGKLYGNGRESAKFSFTTAAPNTLLAPAFANTGTTTPTSIAIGFTATTGSVSTTLRIYSRSTGQLISTIPGYTTNTVINNPITPGSSYSVTLQAIGNGITTITSDESSPISIATPGAITLFAPPVTNTVTTPVSVTVSFTAQAGAVSQVAKLYSGDGQTLLGVYAGMVTGSVLSQLQPNTTYQISITALGNGYSYLTSPESQRVTFKTSAPITMVAPTFSAYSLGGTSIGLSVNAVTGANTYTVKTYSADGSTLISVLNVTTALTPIGGLSPNTTYQFSVTAVGNGLSYLSSPESPKISATTSALTTALPSVANQAWIKGIGGFGADAAQNSVLVDSANNVYVGGYFVNQAVFGSGSNTVTLTSAGGQDSFLAKYSSDGTLLWAQQSGGTGNDYVNALAFDATGNVVVTGVFQGVAAFGQTGNRQAITAMGGYDGYVAKYATDGTFAWVRQLSGTADVFSRGVSTDRSGNIFITGYFMDNVTFGSGSSKVVLRTFGQADGFVAKYAANGTFTWVKQFGGLSGDQGNGISVDRSGNVFVAGSATTGAVFGSGSNSKEFLPEAGSDSFIAKYTNDGDFSWVQASGGSGNDQALAVATDVSGNAYLVGAHSGSVFGSGADTQALSPVLNIINGVTADGFLAKYDPTGRLVWVRNMGGQSTDQYNSVAVDASGNVYAGGQFNISAKVSGGGKSQTLVADGSQDGLVAKYTSDGTLVWARPLGGAASDAATGVAVGSSGALAVTGYFTYDQPTTGGVSVFSLGDTAVNLTSAGNSDAFVALLQTGADVTSSSLVTPVPQINEIKSTSAAISFALQAGAASYTLKLYDSAGTTLISTVSNYIPGRLITGLTANTSYKVTLTAVGDGASTLSSAESAKLTLTTSLGSTSPIIYNIGADQALVTFAPIAGATSYSLQVYDATGANRLFTVNAATPAATWIYNLIPNTSYKVAVRPFSDGQSNLVFGEGSLVSFTTAAATTLANPVATQSASTATTVTINIPTILISPQMIAGNRGWLIKTYAADGVTLLGAFPTTVATNVINGLNPATTYKVSVTALGDGIQYLSSAEGTRVLVSTAQATVAAAPSPIITQITSDTLAVNFAPIPALVSTSYIVRINGFTYIAATSGSIYSTGVLPNSAMSVSMQAIGDGTNLFTSAIGTPVTFNTPTQSTTQLAAPSVAVTAVLQSSANIMPTPVVGATQYFASIYDSTGTNLIFNLPVALGGTQISNLLPNTTYKVEVVAVGNGAFLTNSNPSTQVSFTTAAAGTLAAPINLLATSVNTTSFKPTFTTVANAVNYLLKVYRADGVSLLFTQIITSGAAVNFALNGATSFKFSVTAIGDAINYLTSPESALVNVDLLPVQTLLAPAPALSSITSNSAIVGFTATLNSVSTYARIYAADGTTLLAAIPLFTGGTKLTYPLGPNTSYYISLQAVGDSTNYLTSAEGAKVAFTTPSSVKLLAPLPQIVINTNRSVYLTYVTAELGLISARASIYNADGSQLLFVVPVAASGANIAGLTPNTTYRIVLTALGDGVNFTNSDPGQYVSFTTPASVQLYAPTPSVGFNGAYSFKVNFSPVSGAIGYYAKVYASDGTTLLRTMPITSGSAIFGLPTATSYKLSLVSVGDSLIYTNSPESTKISFTFAGGATNSQLTAPTPTFTGTTSNSTIVNFDTATGANAYTLKRYTADGVTLLQTLTFFTPGTIVANLSPATGYKFSLTAIGDGVSFLNSAEGVKTLVTTTALVAASLLPTVASVVTTSTANSNSITVTFPAATGASSYNVRVYGADGSTLIASVNNFTSGGTITGLIASTNYFVTVTALGDGSTYISAAESAKESVTTLAPGTLTAPVLTKSGQTSNSISVTFPGQSGAAGYSASLYAADGTTLLGVYSPFTSGSSITGLAPNTSYIVKVVALGDGISSSNSAASTALTAVTALASPANIVVAPRAQTAVVQFSAVSGAISYTLNLYNSTGSSLLRTISNFTSGSTLTGLSASTSYRVAIVAIGDASTAFTSDESAQVAFVTPAIITLAAPVVSASTATTSSVSATFAAVPDALSYTAVLYATDGTTVISTLTGYTSGQVITGLSANEIYQLTVQAIGDGTNFLSSLVSGRALLPTVNQTTLVAPTPSASAATSSAVTVSFTATAHSISTTLKLYAPDGTTLLRTIPNFVSGTTLTGLSSGTSYKVTLTAIGDGVSYLTSAEGSLATAATATIATLAAPSATASGATTFSINVSFSGVAGATSYLVKVYAGDGTTLLRTVSQITSGQTISGLSPATSYVLKFSSIGDGVNYRTSADSAGVQVTTTAQITLTAPTPAITQVTATTVSFAFTADSNGLSTTARLYTGDGATLISQISNATTGMQFTGLTPDTDYMVTLQSIGDGITTLSSVESTQVAAHSAQPTALVAPTASISQITSSGFTITFSPKANALGYLANIYAADGVTLIASYTGLNPSGTVITGLTQNTTYKVTLVSVGDEATYLSSAESAPVQTTTAVGVVQLGPPNPSVDAVGSTTAKISFGAVDGASSYAAKIYAADGTTLLQTLSNFTSGQVVTGLTLNTAYFVALNAVGNGVNFLTSGYGPKTSFATAPPEQLVTPVVTSASSTSNSTSLSFAAVTDALDYAVKIYAADGTTLLYTLTSYAAGSTISGLTPSTGYVLKVSALGDGVSILDSPYSTGFSITTQAPVQLTSPSPSVFSASQTNAVIVYTSISGAAGYTAKLYAANGVTLVRTITNFTSGSTITGLTPNTVYQLTLTALGDGLSNTTSAESALLEVDTLAIQTLSAPTAFISGQNPRSLVVSFSPIQGAVSYTALLYAADGTTLLRTVNNFTSGSTLASLTISTNYQVALIAKGDGTNYLDSATGALTATSTIAIPALFVPDTIASATGTTSATASFSAQANAQRFELQVLAADGVSVVRTISNFTSGSTITGLSPSTTYGIAVRAVADGVNYVTSDFSSPAYITTAAPVVLGSPTASVSGATFNTIDVSFTAVANSTGYVAKLYSAGGTLLRTITSFTSGTTITGLTVGTSYQVAVVALGDVTNFLDSPESTRVNYSSSAAIQLAAPSVSTSSVGQFGFQFGFTNVSHGVSYNATLYAANGTTVVQSWTNISGTTTVTGLLPSTRYYLSLTTIGDANYTTSNPSSQLAVTTQNLNPLGTVTVSTSNAGFNSIAVSFGAVANAISYTANVYSATGTLVRSVTSFVSGSTISGLTVGTNYLVGVVAVADNTSYLDSPESVRASFATLAAVQLAAPSFTASGLSKSGFQFSFNSVAHAVSYSATLYAANGTTVLQSWTNITGTTTVSGLSPVTTYKLSMTAVGDSNYLTSSASALTTVTTANLDALTAPSSSTSSAGFNSIVVSFGAVSNAVSYTAKLYTSGGSLLRTITSFTTGSTISGLTVGTGYLVGVTAVADQTTYLDSAESTRAGFSTLAAVQLAAPSFAVSALTHGGFQFSFTPVSNAVSYNATLYAANGTTVVQTWTNVTGTTSVTGLSPVTTYKLSMTSVGDSNYLTSSPSAQTSVVTPNLDPLSAATVATSGADFNSITVTFGAVTNAVGYTANVYTAGGSLLRIISNFISGTTITGLTVGTSYLVGVVALADATNYRDGSESTRVSFSTLAAVQLAAPTYTVTGITHGGFQFNFNSVSNAVSYSATLFAANGTTIIQTWATVTGATTVTSLSANTTYKLSMTSIGDSNHLTSAPSSLTTVVTANLDPLTATSVSTSGADVTSIVITFGPVSNAVSYTAKVYSSTGSLLRTISNFNSGNSITGLSVGTNYLVGITAIADASNYRDGAESTRASFSTLAATQLAAPTFVVSNVTDVAFTLTLTPVANATGYTATLYAADGTTIIRSWSTTSGAHAFSGLTATTDYQLTLLSVGDGVGYLDSAESVQAPFTTLEASIIVVPPTPVVVPPVVVTVPVVTGGANGKPTPVDLTKIFNTPSVADATATLLEPNANVSGISVVNGNLVVKTPAFFSGKTSVKILVMSGGVQVLIDTPIIVQPASVTQAILTPWALSRSTVRWFPSSNAAYYQVTVNGKVICETVGESCAVDTAVGPATQITVTPFSSDGVAGAKAKVAFGVPAALIAGTVWLNTGTSTLSVAEKIALRNIASTIKATGFKKLTLVKPIQASPAARAKMIAAQRFLQTLTGKSVTTSTQFSALASGMDIKLG